jgi:DNA polymerase III subunit alpha
VLPPDINESSLDFLSLEGRIRFGMLAIRNVGEGAIRSILQFRNSHGRFRNLFQFCEEVDVRSLNKRALESLVKSGALDSLGWKRSQCMAMLDAAIEFGQKARRDRESGQKGLFANLSASGQAGIANPVPPDMPEWASEQRLAFEKETLGFYVSGHPLDRFAEEVSRYSKKNIAELISEGKSDECQVAGIITDFRTRRTKKGDLMALFSLEDLTGAVETLVFPNSYSKFEPYMTADFPILVSGRFESENERSCKIIASEVQPLSGIAQRNAKTLRICACISDLSPTSATELHRLLDRNRGETGVEVELYHPSDFRVNIQSSDFVKVKASPELITQIEGICGLGSVRVVH